jgi:hypothetical protein
MILPPLVFPATTFSGPAAEEERDEVDGALHGGRHVLRGRRPPGVHVIKLFCP